MDNTVRNGEKSQLSVGAPMAGVQKNPSSKPLNISAITLFSENRDEISSDGVISC